MIHVVYGLYDGVTLLYIGVTKYPLSTRLSLHISSGASEYGSPCTTHGEPRQRKAEYMMRAKLGEVSIEIRELAKINGRKEAMTLEQHQIELLRPPLNSFSHGAKRIHAKP